jgi:chemotaxis signal transduction protein
MEPGVLDLANGSSASSIVIHDGHYAIRGCTVSSGYREFKVSDGYRDDVLAIVFESFGEVRERLGAGPKGQTVLKPDQADGGGREFATFFIDGVLFALPAEHVLQALSASKISTVSRGTRKACIGLLGLQREAERNGSVWVFDLGYLLHGRHTLIHKSSQVTIVRFGEQTIGLLVDTLHGVPAFNAAQIMQTPFAGRSDGKLVKSFIKANGGQLLIQAVDVGSLFALLMVREGTVQIS